MSDIKVGDNVVVRDDKNWYNGRIGVVEYISEGRGFVVARVSVPSPTGNARITFSTETSKLEKIP